MIRVGLISDTHALLRPEAADFLRGADAIVHAGDIGDPAVLEQLRAIAPVTAVRGNVDRGPWAETVRSTEVLQVGAVFVYVLHNLDEIDLDPAAAGFQVVVSGHTHQPLIAERDGVLYVNPGSAGPRRFRLPVALGELVIDGNSVRPRIVELAPDPAPQPKARSRVQRREGNTL
ncbi:MAG TPA: metallophosphoesterase family protein [Pelomicrobium sp.]|nr:metallophosphoesterase family protein [Pelomicrobium sp.]